MEPQSLAFDGVPEKFGYLGLTFDDVLLVPNESDVVPTPRRRPLSRRLESVLSRARVSEREWAVSPLAGPP